MSIILSPSQIQVPSGGHFHEVTNGTNSFRDLWGSGSPEGVVAANRGSSYRDITNGVIYVKVTGTGNTGWSAVTSAATEAAANTFRGNPTAATAAAQDIAVAAERALGRTAAGNLAALSPQDFRAVSRRAMFAIPFAATINWDLANGTYQSIASTGDFTLNFPSNVVAGEKVTLYVTGSATSMTLGAGFEGCNGGTSPIALSGSKNRVEIFFDTATTATVYSTCPNIKAPVIVNPVWSSISNGAFRSFGGNVSYTSLQAFLQRRRESFPATYFNDATHHQYIPSWRFIPAANGGIPQGVTPANVNLNIPVNLVNVNHAGVNYPMKVELYGIAGSYTDMDAGNSPFNAALSNLTTASSANSYEFNDNTTFTGPMDFDVTDIVTEIASEPTWNENRRMYFIMTLTADSSTSPTLPAFGVSGLTFRSDAPFGATLTYTN